MKGYLENVRIEGQQFCLYKVARKLLTPNEKPQKNLHPFTSQGDSIDNPRDIIGSTSNPCANKPIPIKGILLVIIICDLVLFEEKQNVVVVSDLPPIKSFVLTKKLKCAISTLKKVK